MPQVVWWGGAPPPPPQPPPARGACLLDAAGRVVAGLRPATTQCRRDHAPRFHAEDRPQALAAGKHAVPHGLMDGGWMLGGGGQELFEGAVGVGASLLQNVFQHDIAV